MRDNSRQWSVLFLVLAVLFGGMVRFAPAVLGQFPINDGGMFYTMIGDLRANGFALPAETSYNYLGIPYAYPPLSLYAGALLSALGIPTMEVIRWLPALVSTLSILAFYWMATQMLGAGSIAALSTLAYALMPRSFSWYVMGGGLSRGLGMLFLLLTCGAVWIMFSRPGLRVTLLAAVCGAGAVLSHPETALHTVAACLLIWLFRGRTASSVRSALIVAAGALVLTSPWWVTVLIHNGFGTVVSALSAGGHSPYFWTSWLTMDFSEERYVTWLTVLGLLGFVIQSIKRQWFLPVWLLLPFAVEPRSAPAIAALPLAVLAGSGLADFVIPGVSSLVSGAKTAEADWTHLFMRSRAVKVVTSYIVLAALVGAFSYDLALARYIVPVASRRAMQWVRENTPAGARFLVLTSHSDPFSDPSAEWFPALAERTSSNTIQGQEWTLGQNFMPFLTALQDLPMCLTADPACLETWAADHGAKFDYVYLQTADSLVAWPSGLLLYQLRQDPNYTLVFENEGIAIFQRK